MAGGLQQRRLGYRAEQVDAFVRQQITELGISPSYAEIRDALDLDSKSSVHRIIVCLEGRGKLKRQGNRWGRKGQRVIRLVI